MVAENAFHVVGSHEQSFIWNECGFRLYVPESALYPSKTCTIAVKALIAGRFVLPKNTELVSGLYAISSSRRFQAKVKIEIQHCVLLKNKAESKHLRFIKAHQTQPGALYHFSLQQGGEFPINSHYGGLWQSEFSIFGAVDVNEQEESSDDDADHTDDTEGDSDSTDEETSSSEEESNEKLQDIQHLHQKETNDLVGAYEDEDKPKRSPKEVPISKKEKPNRKRSGCIE